MHVCGIGTSEREKEREWTQKGKLQLNEKVEKKTIRFDSSVRSAG